ncbi:histidine biosynthesis protein [Paraburkholderia fungorum]|uniref:H-NS histone family protein n=1 Tax=Paraburkholderia fungorum TaxID=134537 RepID=UPI000487AD8C|nr:H-NS histone family protein [Paraburkholderia fungorum]PNE59782.1 histidine biosynthesis protein [Paraburkholderia fungorum]
MATIESLNLKIRKLQQQAEVLIAKQATATLNKIHDLMNTHGISLADIERHLKGKPLSKSSAGEKSATKLKVSTRVKAPPQPKYRDPKTGATWTGHGRAPGWIASAKDRTKFLIDGASPAAKPEAGVANTAPAKKVATKRVAAKKAAAKKSAAKGKVVARKAAAPAAKKTAAPKPRARKTAVAPEQTAPEQTPVIA